MEKWSVPPHMAKLANKTTQVFGYDHNNTVAYKFNHLGFRTGSETGSDSINLIGNSISFGIGLEYQQTFGSIVASNLKRKLENFSYGCYLHDNHDHLSNLNLLAKRDSDDLFFIQINNLDRIRVDSNLVVLENNISTCKTRFLDYFDQVTQILKNKKKIFLYWDDKSYDLPKSVTDQFLIHNKCHIDTSLIDYPNSFGVKSNRLIAKIITIKLKLT
jgi:hypothetical protein